MPMQRSSRCLIGFPVLTTTLERGSLAGRSSPMRLALAIEAPASGTENLTAGALPTPAVAPMEATLYPVRARRPPGS